MAMSSITHNFIMKDKASAEKLANALSMPKSKSFMKEEDEKRATAKMVTGHEELTRIMDKWRNL